MVLISTLVFSTTTKAEWKTVVTDTQKDCVVVSSATDEAPIDFFASECKAFGGFTLSITGSDLRYAPELTFADSTIDLKNPPSFHDLASTEIEWLYEHKISNEGLGEITWRGIIYKLSSASEDGESDVEFFYAVKLNGAKSCALGKVETKAKAVKLVHESKCL
jgi:hypothetical protein